jgi:hypothetical protein
VKTPAGDGGQFDDNGGQASLAASTSGHTMIYKFKSKAAADLIMTAPIGDRDLTLIGKGPAAKGIIEVAELPGAIQALEQAVRAESPQGADEADDDGGDPGASGDHVSLRRRFWPMIEMMKRALAGNEPIVWGV